MKKYHDIITLDQRRGRKKRDMTAWINVFRDRIDNAMFEELTKEENKDETD
jgi:hypothetical protein